MEGCIGCIGAGSSDKLTPCTRVPNDKHASGSPSGHDSDHRAGAGHQAGFSDGSLGYRSSLCPLPALPLQIRLESLLRLHVVKWLCFLIVEADFCLRAPGHWWARRTPFGGPPRHLHHSRTRVRHAASRTPPPPLPADRIVPLTQALPALPCCSLLCRPREAGRDVLHGVLLGTLLPFCFAAVSEASQRAAFLRDCKRPMADLGPFWGWVHAVAQLFARQPEEEPDDSHED